MAKVSINLLTFNAEKYLDACLESVRCQSFCDFEILVIDNASGDKTREKIEDWRKVFEEEGVRFKTIDNEKNVGFAEGHNRGFKFLISNFKFQNNEQISNFKFQKLNPPLSPFAKGGNNIEYVCCLNQDIILRPDYLEKLVDFMDAHPECGAASGKLMRIIEDDLFFDILNANGHESEHESTRKIPPAPFFKGGENYDLISAKKNGIYGEGKNRPPLSKEPALSDSRMGGKGDLSEDSLSLVIDYKRLARECTIIDSVGIKMFKSHRAVEIGQGEEDTGKYTEIKEVFGVSGTVPVYRVEALEDVRISNFKSIRQAQDKLQISKLEEGESFEYFDKDFGSYKEDVDLAYRLRWRGWKSFTVPEAVAYHKRGARQLKNKRGDFTAAFNRKNKPKYINCLSQRNHVWTLIKNMDTLNFATLWYEAKKFGYEMIFEWSTFKAWFDIWKKMGVMREKRKCIMANRKVSAEEMERWMEG